MSELQERHQETIEIAVRWQRRRARKARGLVATIAAVLFAPATWAMLSVVNHNHQHRDLRSEALIFEKGEAELRARGESVLRRVCRHALEYEEGVFLVGSASAEGSRTRNWRLGRARARNAKARLMELCPGIGALEVRAVSVGEELSRVSPDPSDRRVWFCFGTDSECLSPLRDTLLAP